MKIEKSRNDLILKICDSGCFNLFPAHVLHKKPNQYSTTVTEGSNINCFAVNGLDWDLFEVSNYWIFAKSAKYFEFMMQNFISLDRIKSFNFDKKYITSVKTLLPDYKLELEEHYLLHNKICKQQKNDKVVKLDINNLPHLTIDSEIKNMIGSFNDFPENCDFWGYVDKGSILAIAECFIQYNGFNSIQQVYTKTSQRRKGIAFSLISTICEYILENEMKPTYLVNSTNISSIYLAKKIGFKKYCEYGYAHI